MARFLWKLVPLVPVFSLALAQSVTILKTYYATDLERSPGLIQLSPGFTTVIDCWDLVDSVASAKPELLRLEVNGPRILLSAQQKAGKTDLILEVGGRTLLFTVDIASGSMPRRYKIELSRPSPQSFSPSGEGASLPLFRENTPLLSGGNNTPTPSGNNNPKKPSENTPAPSGENTLTPSTPSVVREKAKAPSPKSSPPLLGESTPRSREDAFSKHPPFLWESTSCPREDAFHKPPAPQERLEEDGVRFTATSQISSNTLGTVSVFYTLENRSSRSIAVDPSRLMVLQGNEHLPYTLKREPMRSILAPGEVQSGLLVIKGAWPVGLNLVWTLVEIGTGREIYLSRNVTPAPQFNLQMP